MEDIKDLYKASQLTRIEQERAAISFRREYLSMGKAITNEYDCVAALSASLKPVKVEWSI